VSGIAELVSPQSGHFLLESGFHGNLWLDLEALFLRPERIAPPALELSRRLAQYGAEVVCGPLVEGAFLALMVARQMNLPFTYSERFLRDDARSLYPFGYRIPSPLHPHVRGKRAVVVNDVIGGGSAVGGTWEELEVRGGIPVAIGALLVVGEWTSRFAGERKIGAESLESMTSDLWTPGECPLCARREPLVRP